MDTPADRLKLARLRAGFDRAVEAADAMGVRRSTYIGHENGSRGLRPKTAERYSRRFKVTAEWLLYARGEGPGSAPNPESEARDIIKTLPKERQEEALDYLRYLASKSALAGV